ncbi:MAG: diguanylate cyclase [Burkholderiales bacterium]|jgi:PleD family two-component response regulator|nr:diguanylate cyclase [Burkholderiales bacterium]
MNTFSPVDNCQVPGAADAPARRPRLPRVADQRANPRSLYHVFAPDHDVFMATGGEQALAACAGESPHRVLPDAVMPGTDGHDFCRRMKADAATRDIPGIFVTAQTYAAEEALSSELGAVDFFSRPINPNLVRARVKTHLTLKARSDLLRQWLSIDGLTGLHKRRRFDARLQSEWGRAAHNRCAPGAVMLDVDHVKRNNERYGHQAGDECLRRDASVCDCLGRPELANAPGEAFCTLPFPRKNRPHTCRFVGT